MRLSQYFIPTLREAPQEAETMSHKLMLRAGMIRQLASGLYAWLPLGLLVLENIIAIIREEMEKSVPSRFYYRPFNQRNCGKSLDAGIITGQSFYVCKTVINAISALGQPTKK